MKTIYEADDGRRIEFDGIQYHASEAATFDGQPIRQRIGLATWGSDSALTHIGIWAAEEIAKHEEQLRQEKFGSRPETARPCFVRFGKLPPGGQSRDYRAGTEEPGIAVYAGFRDKIGYILDLRGAIDCASAMFIIGTAQAYEVAGTRNGKCSDGAPTLADARIVRRIQEKIELLS